MLTLEENGWNFKYIKFYSLLNNFPVQIDMESGKIRIQNQGWSNKIRRFLWNASFCLGIAHALFMLARLVQSTIVEPEKLFRWDHFIIHLPFTLGYSIDYCIGFFLFRKSPEETVIIFNQLFVESQNPVQKMMDQEKEEQEKKLWDGRKKAPGQNQQLDSKRQKSPAVRPRPRPLLTWPLQYSVDEIFARTFPLTNQATILFVVAVFAVDPNGPQLLSSILPPEYKNMYSLCGLLAVEAAVVTLICNLFYFSTVCQLLFFGKIQLEFQRLNLQLRNLKEKFQSRQTLTQERDLKREIWILRQILKSIKKLEVFLELFNRCFPPCIFAFKLKALGFSIFFYFFTIRHGEDFPFLAAFTGYIGSLITIVYGILYQKAFSIPQKMERLKIEFLISTHKTTSTSTSKSETQARDAGANPHSDVNSKLLDCFGAEMVREIGAIRDVGVKVGSFHTLERESIPTFVDFLVNQVVSLLVSFPR